MRFPLPSRRVSGPLLMIALLLAACGAPAAPAAARSAASPTAAVPAPQTLTVFAAASLTESFGEMGKLFEAAHPGVKVVFNFAGSQQLRAQLEQGARADVFASANQKEMDAAIRSSLVVWETQRTFARNRLVVIFPKDNPGKIVTLADLARPGLKLVVADKGAPAGQYTLDILDRMSRAEPPTYGADFAERVQQNIVSRETDVKVVVSKVRLGEADAGIVYSTDVTPAAAQDVTPLRIPDQFNRIAAYPIAPLLRAARPGLAQQFIDLVMSGAGLELLAGFGFIIDR